MLFLPSSLDGKTKYIEHKSWKPSGGRNLKMFLSNDLPAPSCRTDLLDDSTRRYLTRIKRVNHPSILGQHVQKAFDIGAYSYEQMDETGQVQSGTTVRIPESLANVGGKQISTLSLAEIQRLKIAAPSDISTNIIDSALSTWHAAWDDADIESDDDYKPFKWVL